MEKPPKKIELQGNILEITKMVYEKQNLFMTHYQDNWEWFQCSVDDQLSPLIDEDENGLKISSEHLLLMDDFPKKVSRRIPEITIRRGGKEVYHPLINNLSAIEQIDEPSFVVEQDGWHLVGSRVGISHEDVEAEKVSEVGS